jgi:predicted neuraminidase
VATNLRNPGSGVDVASSNSGRLLLVYNDSEQLRTPLTLGISPDEGRTWLTHDVEAGPGEFSYPKLLQTRDGLWHLFYTYQRTHIQHLAFAEGFFAGGRKAPGFPT